MSKFQSLMVATLVLAIVMIAGNSAANQEVTFSFGNTSTDGRVTNGSLSAKVGETLKVVVAVPGNGCASDPTSMRLDASPSNLVSGLQKYPCESSKGVQSYALTFLAAKAGSGTIKVWSGGYSSESVAFVVADPYPAPSTFVPRKEYDERVDEVDDRFDGLAPFEQRVGITVGLLTGPNMYDEEAGVPRGFQLALGVKPLDRSNLVAQLKLQAAVYYRHQSVYVNPNLDPTNLDSTEDVWFVGLGAFWSPEWSWGEFNLGARVGAAQWQYPDTLLDQHSNLVVEEENQLSTTTFQLEPVIGVNFFPHANIILGVEGWGSYNVNPINRYVGNDGDPNGHHIILSAAFLAGVRL